MTVYTGSISEYGKTPSTVFSQETTQYGISDKIFRNKKCYS